MSRPFATSFVLLLAACLAALPLAACGGGGTGSGGQTVVAQLPQAPTPDDPASPPTPDPTQDPAQDPPADEPSAEDPPADNPPSDEPSDPPAEPPAPPKPPAALPSFEGLPPMRAAVFDPAENVLWAVPTAGGELFRWQPGDEAPLPVGSLDTQDVRGLAIDPMRSVLYAIADDDPNPDDRLLRIDPHSREVAAIGTITGYGHLEGLAWHASLGCLFATDTTAGVLVRIDPETAEPTLVGSLGAYTDLRGLAPDPEGGRLFAADATAKVIVGVDVTTGRTTRLTDAGDAAIEALAYDEDAQHFVAASVEPARLWVFDPIGAWMAYADIRALAWDPTRERLLGSYPPNGLVVAIDPETGWKRGIGYVPVAGIEGLAFDAGSDRLFAVSGATQTLYELSPDDASIRTQHPLVGAPAPFTGLSSLAYANGALYASDRTTQDLLRIETATGNAVVVTTLAAWPGIEGLATDPLRGEIHAWSNATQTHLVIDPANPSAPRVVAQGPYTDLRGLGWVPASSRLYGSDATAKALALVYEAEPPALGYDDVRALVYRADTGRWIGFDAPTATFIEIDPVLELGMPFLTWEGSAVEGMTYDPAARVVLAVDGATGSLHAIDDGWQSTLVGEAGVLAAYDVKALAYDEAGQVLYAVDDASNRLLAIDRATGVATVVDPTGDGLGFDTIEAMVFDASVGRLIALDRQTASLLNVDVNTGVGSAYAVVPAADVHAMALVPGQPRLWLVAGSDLWVVARDTGEIVPDAETPKATRSLAEAPPVRLLWPRGDVAADALDTCAFEVNPSWEGDLVLEFLHGNDVIFRTTLAPQDLLAEFEIPVSVRRAMALGQEVSWRAASARADFVPVDARVAHEQIARVLAHPTMTDRSAWERDLVKAFLLDRYRLHAEALRVGLQVFREHPERKASATALLRSLGYLQLADSTLGARARSVLLGGS